mgnify:CR=1 FL=1
MSRRFPSGKKGSRRERKEKGGRSAPGGGAPERGRVPEQEPRRLKAVATASLVQARVARQPPHV